VTRHGWKVHWSERVKNLGEGESGRLGTTGERGTVARIGEIAMGTPELSRTRDRATNPEICGSRNREPATMASRTQHFRIICIAGPCFVAVENCGQNSGSNMTGVSANSRATISTLARAKQVSRRISRRFISECGSYPGLESS